MTPKYVYEASADLSELALDIAEQACPTDTIDRVAELAAKLIPCAASDIIRVNGLRELRIIASSDPGLSGQTEKVWRRWPHTLQAAGGSAAHAAMVLQRGSYRQQLQVTTGIVEELIVPLRAGPTDHGYLRFLLTEPHAAAADRTLISGFCAHAAIALDRAALFTQVASLRIALEGNRRIGAAIGILMARENLTYSQGLNRLTTSSSKSNRKLRDIAAEVLVTGQL